MFLSELLLWLARSGWLMLLHVGARAAFPSPLEPAEEQAMIARMLEGDAAARQALIEHNLRLAAHIARKYAQPGVDQDDLISIGTLGLIKAVRSFRPEAGKLTAYAARCIENEILMYFRADRKNRNTLLLGDSLGQDKDGNELEISELLGTDANLVPDAAETAIEFRRARGLMSGVLDAREREVIQWRYGLIDGVPLQQRQVGEKLGISRSYVSRIEKCALEKLRAALESPSPKRESTLQNRESML